MISDRFYINSLPYEEKRRRGGREGELSISYRHIDGEIGGSYVDALLSYPRISIRKGRRRRKKTQAEI